MLKKLCSYGACHKVVDAGQQYCSRHADYNRHMLYKAMRMRDQEEAIRQRFYNSKEWLRFREMLAHKQLCLYIYAYYKYGEIVAADTYHHIIELKEDYSLRISKDNVIGLTYSNHQTIHELYDQNNHIKRQTQYELKAMLMKFHNEFIINDLALLA
ncbi:MAG: hypothetical protein E7262_09640 [Lachnospiraceae bacterium]|nr:hypothetical protein [Lachnospiraceae bacterium]